MCYHQIDACSRQPVKPGVHTNDFAPIHGRRARIHTAPEEDNTLNQQSTPQVLCELLNTGAATVNRGEIVSMYAGLYRYT